MAEARTTKWVNQKYLEQVLGTKVQIFTGFTYNYERQAIHRILADVDHDVLEEAILNHPPKGKIPTNPASWLDQLSETSIDAAIAAKRMREAILRADPSQTTNR